MGLLHTVQLLQRGKKSISSYGTQNKEAKNKLMRDFFESFSRKDDNWHALEDTMLRDTLVTSHVVRTKGTIEHRSRCSGCKKRGHLVNKRPAREGVEVTELSNKFLDSQDFSDPLRFVRDGAAPESSEGEESDSDTSEPELTPGKAPSYQNPKSQP